MMTTELRSTWSCRGGNYVCSKVNRGTPKFFATLSDAIGFAMAHCTLQS